MEHQIAAKVIARAKGVCLEKIKCYLAGDDPFQSGMTGWKDPVQVPSWRICEFSQILFDEPQVEDGCNWNYCSGKLYSPHSENIEMARRGGPNGGSVVFYAGYSSRSEHVQAARYLSI
jgi:hypothetical protein